MNQTSVVRYLDWDAEQDEHQISSGQADQEHIGDGVHGPAAHYADNHQYVAGDAEQERETVRHAHGNQLPEDHGRDRVVVVVVVIVVVLAAGVDRLVGRDDILKSVVHEHAIVYVHFVYPRSVRCRVCIEECAVNVSFQMNISYYWSLVRLSLPADAMRVASLSRMTVG